MRGSGTRRWRLAVATLAVTSAVVSTPLAADAAVSAKKAKVTIGYVVAGDRNDRGFYQGQVEAVLAEAKKLRYKVIVVDKVNPGAAREAFENLCRQNPNLIIGGGSELTDGFVPVSESPECSKITWLLIAGFRPTASDWAATWLASWAGLTSRSSATWSET
jgi:basic membrane lipoprotein Med (substrate-binding protein (PBP1-ABC) superfamily)